MNKISINTAEGHPISVSEFVCSAPAKASILIASATGVKKEYYQKFAEFLSRENFNVYTFDYEGIGESRQEPIKKNTASASSWTLNDLDAAIKHIKGIHSDTKLILIGHSIGGQLIGLAPSSRLADAIILVAAQTGYWRFWKGFNKIKMYATWHFLIPTLTTLFGYFPGKKLGLSEDLPKNMALEWRKWCRSKNYLFDHYRYAKQKYESIHCPIISFSAEDDDFAPRATVDWLTEKYSKATLQRKHLIPSELGVKNIGHFGFFRSKYQTPIWDLFLTEIERAILDV